MQGDRLWPLLRLGVAVTLASGARTWAAGYTWNSASTGLWSQSAKWTPSTGTPGTASGDTATISQGGSYACILDYTPTFGLSGLTMKPASGDVRLIVSNATLTSTGWTIKRAGLELADGGKFYLQGDLQPTGNDNAILVGGGSATSIFSLNNRDVLMPQAVDAPYRNNTITIDANGSITNVGAASFGFCFGWAQGYPSDQNVLRVQNGGRLTVGSRGCKSAGATAAPWPRRATRC